MHEDLFHLGVKALIRNEDGKLLLLKINPAELRGHEGASYWDIPGGRIHRGDTAETTLRREVKEETDLDVATCQPFFMTLSPLRIPMITGDDVGLILSVYLCEVGKNTQIKISKEHIEFGWFIPSEAAQLLQIKYPSEFTERIKKYKD